MILRKMQLTDIGVCARLMAASPLWQRYGVTEAIAAARFEQGLAHQADITVVEQDGEVAGFIWYAARGAFNRSGYIMLVGVDPDRLKQGIGRVLMEHAEQELFRTGKDIFLLVSDFNTDAQRFYRRLGYRQVGAIPDYLISGVAELIYHKPGLSHEQHP